MNKKQIILGVLALLFSTFVSAQTKHEVSIVAGGGISTLDYKADVGDKELFSKDNIGGAFGFGYTIFFSDNIGLGTGAEFTFYRAKLEIDKLTMYLSSGQANIYDFEEKQSSLFVNVPIMLHFRSNGENRFYFNVGGKIGFPTNTKYTIDGYTTGSDYTTLYLKNKEEAVSVDLNVGFMASMELGMQWKLSSKSSLYTGAYFDYGLTNTLKDKDNRTDFILTDQSNTINKSTRLNSVLTSQYKDGNNETQVFTDRIVPMAAGLRLRLAFMVEGTKRPKKVKSSVKKESKKYTEKKEKTEEVKIEEKPEEKVVKKEVAQQPKPEPAKQQQAAQVQQEAPKQTAQTTPPQRQARPAAQRGALSVAGVMAPKGNESIESSRSGSYTYNSEYDRGIITPAMRAQVRAVEQVEVPVVSYSLNGTSLTEEQKRDMDQKIAILKRYPSFSVICIGYTCNSGAEEINKIVGMGRALAAKKYFIENGIDPSRIMTVSKGQENPLVPNTSEDNRRKNRRVEFIVLE